MIKLQKLHKQSFIFYSYLFIIGNKVVNITLIITTILEKKKTVTSVSWFFWNEVQTKNYQVFIYKTSMSIKSWRNLSLKNVKKRTLLWFKRKIFINKIYIYIEHILEVGWVMRKILEWKTC